MIRRFEFVFALGVFGLASVAVCGCSSSKNYAPSISNDCTEPPCGSVGVVGGRGAGTGGTSGVTTDGGIVQTGQFSTCNQDPTTGVVLCLGSSACPGVLIDAVQFSNCGYDAASPGDPVVACLCQLPNLSLCPIAIGTACNGIPGKLAAAQSGQDLCNQATNCRDLSNVTGAGGGAGGASSCSPDCLASCNGTPGCTAFCGC